MSRWVKAPVNALKETPKVDAFIDELKAVCRKHKMCLEHEDPHGAFIIAPLDYEQDLEWLDEAHVKYGIVQEGRL